MDELKLFYKKKLQDQKVALTGVQLQQEALKQKWKGVTPDKVYKFLRQEAPGEPGRWGRVEKPIVRVGMSPARPGIYFIDYGEFHKNWSSHNDGCTGFLVAVEQFTNRAFVLPTRGKDTSQWLDSIAKFVEMSRQVAVIYSDRDSVAQSSSFRDGLQKKYQINWRFLKKGLKAFTAERMIGIVKTALSKVLEYRKDEENLSDAKVKRWVDLIGPFVSNYNQQLVPGTPYKRQAVSRENFNDFYAKLTGDENFDLTFNAAAAGPFASTNWNAKIFKFDIGDGVRISRAANWKDKRASNSFAKATMVGGLSKEIFTVQSRQLRAAAQRTPNSTRRMVPVYTLKEMGEHGSIFYEPEMQLVKKTLIEKVAN